MSYPPRLKETSGFTIFEVLVASVLFFLFFAIMVEFFQVAGRVAQEELQRNAAETELLNLSGRLRRDLNLASIGGVSLSPDHDTLLVHPVSLTDVGSVVYDRLLVLWCYDPDQKQLLRKETRSFSGFSFDGTPFRPEAAELEALPTSNEFSTAGRFDNVSQFSLTSNPEVEAPFLGSPFTLTLKIELPNSRTRKELDYTEVFQLRNSGA